MLARLSQILLIGSVSFKRVRRMEWLASAKLLAHRGDKLTVCGTGFISHACEQSCDVYAFCQEKKLVEAGVTLHLSC